MRVQHYLKRATDFLEGMKYTREDQSCWNSAALLAIHSAISYSDALRIGLGDHSLSGDNHKKAADSLQKLIPKSSPRDQSGLKHFRNLIAKKHLVAYGSTHLDHTEYKTLFTNAERFAQWADTTGNRLQVKGWKNDGG